MSRQIVVQRRADARLLVPLVIQASHLQCPIAAYFQCLTKKKKKDRQIADHVVSSRVQEFCMGCKK